MVHFPNDGRVHSRDHSTIVLSVIQKIQQNWQISYLVTMMMWQFPDWVENFEVLCSLSRSAQSFHNCSISKMVEFVRSSYAQEKFAQGSLDLCRLVAICLLVLSLRSMNSGSMLAC